MAIKFFCDVCEKEIEPKDAGKHRVVFEKERVQAAVLIAIDGTYGAGHICMKCLKEVLEHGKLIIRTTL